MRELADKKQIEFVYTNHKGETRIRKVVPLEIYFDTNIFHDETPRWYMKAIDCEITGSVNSDRHFALEDIKGIENSGITNKAKQPARAVDKDYLTTEFNIKNML